MSNAFEKLAGLTRLPIFPLPLVLLPNEVVPLHIFEPRYRQMLDDAELAGNVFGLSYFDINEGSEMPAIGSVGCVAEVTSVQRLEDGRSNVVTQGLVRYRVTDYVDAGTPYLMAELEYFEDDPISSDEISPLVDDVHGLFERIAKAAFRMSGNKGSQPEVPKTEPEALSFLVAAAFNFDNELKYSLLELTSTAERLKKLQTILTQAVDQIENSSDIHRLSQTNGHSKKKLDL